METVRMGTAVPGVVHAAAQRAVTERLTELEAQGIALPTSWETVSTLVMERLARAIQKGKAQSDVPCVTAWCREDTVATAWRVGYVERRSAEFLENARRAYSKLGCDDQAARERAASIVLRYYASGPSKSLREGATDEDLRRMTLVWLKTTAFRDLVRETRDKRRFAELADDGGDAHDDCATGGPQGCPPPSPERQAMARSTLARIGDIVPSLQRRIALIATDMLTNPDDAPAERAARLGVTAANVHTQIYRLRGALAAAGVSWQAGPPGSRPDDPDDDPQGPGGKRRGMSTRDSGGKGRGSRSQTNGGQATATHGRGEMPGGSGAAANQAVTLEETARTVGDLLLHGRRDEAEALIAEAADAREAIRSLLEAADGTPIDEAMPGLAEVSAWLAAQPDPHVVPDRVTVAALAVLERRHDVEALLYGAERIAGRDLASEDLATSVEAFDTVARERLWTLVPLNRARRERAAALAPDTRERCWWWSEGADLPEDSVSALRKAARLIAVFPTAQEELDDLIAAARATRAEARPTAEALATSPSDRTTERSGVVYFLQFRAVPSHDGGRLVARGSEEEVVVRPLDGVTLSVDDEGLIVDYEMSCEPDPGRPPVLEPVRGAHIVATEPFVGRFILPFHAMDPAAGSAVLRVPRRDLPDLVVQIPWEVP